MNETPTAKKVMPPTPEKDGGIFNKDENFNWGLKWLLRKHSGHQYGEQGILTAILNRIGLDSGTVCEFGAGDSESTILMGGFLIDKGWSAVLIEADKDKSAKLRERCSRTKYGSRIEIFEKKVGYEGPDTLHEILGFREPNIIVCDVDGNDYRIMERYFKESTHRPEIVMVEHHDLADPNQDRVPNVPPPEMCGQFNGDSGFVVQARIGWVSRMMKEAGYTLASHTRINGIYLRDDLWHKVEYPPISLNIGAGKIQLPGFINLDIKDGVDARSLPYADNSVDEVYASHVLEHVPYVDTIATVREWARVLKPNGTMYISVPDIERIKDEWNAHTRDYLKKVIVGGHTDGDDVHHAVFDEQTLKKVMYAAGIGNLEQFTPFVQDTSRNVISLNIRGTKRYWPAIKDPTFCLILSQPRLGFTDNSDRLIALAARLKFNVMRAPGAFWDRDIETATKKAIRQFRPDFLIYADYDGVFDPQDVEKLILAIQSDPTLAVIGSVQMSRHDNFPLVFDPSVKYEDHTAVPVRYQHFGLTIIRTALFDEMPQPWFWSTPGVKPDGTVGWDGYMESDADITFWRIVAEHGFRVAQHNDVVVGHIVMAVKWPKDSGSGTTLQPIEAYNRVGKPPTAKFVPEVFRAKWKAEKGLPQTHTTEPANG